MHSGFHHKSGPFISTSKKKFNCCLQVLADSQENFLCMCARVGPDVEVASDSQAVCGPNLGRGTEGHWSDKDLWI